MNKRSVKMCVVVAAATGLTGAMGATAWADAFTPAIEEPTFEFGLPQGPGLTPTAPDGNSSSAEGRNGRAYGYDPYGYDTYGQSGERSSSSDDEESSSSGRDEESSSSGRDGGSSSYDEGSADDSDQ